MTTSAAEQDVVLLIGAGGIGVAIGRRLALGKHLVIADVSTENAEREALTLRQAGYDVSVTRCDLSERTDILSVLEFACARGRIQHVVCAGGVSPSQAPIEKILAVDLYGTAVLIEEAGKRIGPGGSGIVISSQSGHRLPPLTAEQNELLALTPSDDLLALDFLQPEIIETTLRAYQFAKRCNVLRVMAASREWGQRGARINSISPGIVMTPLASDEINGPRGKGYRTMLSKMPAGRAGTPDEIAALAEFLCGPSAQFITGSDFLADGGATAAYWFGDLQYLQDGWSRS